MGTIGDRLREERARLGLNQSEFAALADASKKSQIRYEGNERSPDGDYLAALAQAGADITYILTGYRVPSITKEINDAFGTVTAKHASSLAYVAGSKPLDAGEPRKPAQGDFVYAGEDFSMIARRDLSVSAGTGIAAVDGEVAESLAFSRSWLTRNRISPDLAALVRVKGDSMAPTIPNGALVLVNFAERSVISEAIFAFIRDDEAFIKRIAPLASAEDGKPTSVIIMSDNPAYQSTVVTAEALNSIRIIGRIRGVMFSV